MIQFLPKLSTVSDIFVEKNGMINSSVIRNLFEIRAATGQALMTRRLFRCHKRWLSIEVMARPCFPKKMAPNQMDL